jgi:hypothetical protein
VGVDVREQSSIGEWLAGPGDGYRVRRLLGAVMEMLDRCRHPERCACRYYKYFSRRIRR